MLLLRKILAGGLLATSISVITTPLLAEPAQAGGGETCSVTHDGGEYKRGAFDDHGVTLAQLKTKSIPPGGSHVETVEVTNLDVYQAGAKISGSLNTELGNKWLGQVEVNFGIEVTGSGTWSHQQKSTVTDTIVNNSSQNATFVFFRGSGKKVTAPIFVSTCRDDDGGSSLSGHIYWVQVGTFRAFTVPSDGAVRCGAGTANLNSVAKRALAIGCA